MKYSDKYFVLDKDLGRAMTPGDSAYAKKNSIGRPVVELTEEQRYAFDLRGWYNWELHPAQLAQMPPMRQTMFRPVFVGGNVVEEGDA